MVAKIHNAFYSHDDIRYWWGGVKAWADGYVNISFIDVNSNGENFNAYFQYSSNGTSWSSKIKDQPDSMFKNQYYPTTIYIKYVGPVAGQEQYTSLYAGLR